MAAFTKEQVAAALDAKAAHLAEKDLDRIASSHEAVRKLIDEFPDNWAKARRQANLLMKLVETDNVAFESKKQAAAALIYLGAPIDLVPDHHHDGFEDDAAVVGLAISRIEAAVRTYCAEHDLNAAEYLD